MNKTEIGISIIAMVAVGIATLFGFSVHETRQVNKKIGKAAEDLKNASVKDISDAMVQQAIEKAAEQAVSVNVATDNYIILSKAKSSLESQISELVKERYGDAVREVSERIAAQAAKIDDPEALKKAVRSRAEDILVRQFKNELDDLKDRAEDTIERAVSTYEDKLDDIAEKFEDKLDDKLERASDSLQSVKRVYDILGNGLGGKKESSGIRIVTD